MKRNDLHHFKDEIFTVAFQLKALACIPSEEAAEAQLSE